MNAEIFAKTFKHLTNAAIRFLAARYLHHLGCWEGLAHNSELCAHSVSRETEDQQISDGIIWIFMDNVLTSLARVTIGLMWGDNSSCSIHILTLIRNQWLQDCVTVTLWDRFPNTDLRDSLEKSRMSWSWWVIPPRAWTKLLTAMGLISDRKAKKQREKEKELEKLKNAQNRALSPLKKGAGPGGGVMVGRYPAGYYTTPAPQSSSWSHAHGQVHPSQPRPQANVNPRYQTWVAPRKQQPHLNQLVSREGPVKRSRSSFFFWAVISATCATCDLLDLVTRVFRCHQRDISNVTDVIKTPEMWRYHYVIIMTRQNVTTRACIEKLFIDCDKILLFALCVDIWSKDDWEICNRVSLFSASVQQL